MRYSQHKTVTARLLPAIISIASLLSVTAGAGLFPSVARAQGATITDRGVQVSDSRPGEIADYRIFMKLPAAPAVGSIMVEFCENTPIFGVTCDAPAGFDLSGATLGVQSGDSGFSVHPGSTTNMLILTRTAAPTVGGLASSYTLNGVQSAAVEGSQYARFSTYADEDAAGAIVDRGGIAYALNNDFGLTTEVPPNLEFCVGTSIPTANCTGATGNYVLLGEFTTAAARVGTTQMAAATNADNGYTIRINGTTMTSGNNTIPALTAPTFSAPGTSQFGLNLTVNSNPGSGTAPFGPGQGAPAADYNIPNRFVFRNGDILAGRSQPDDYRVYTVNYLVNISDDQPMGVYAGTYNYIALGNF